MKIKVVAVDNAPELLEKMKGIFRNMEQVELLGCFEEAVAVVDFVKENSADMCFRTAIWLNGWKQLDTLWHGMRTVI